MPTDGAGAGPPAGGGGDAVRGGMAGEGPQVGGASWLLGQGTPWGSLPSQSARTRVPPEEASDAFLTLNPSAQPRSAQAQSTSPGKPASLCSPPAASCPEDVVMLFVTHENRAMSPAAGESGFAGT